MTRYTTDDGTARHELNEGDYLTDSMGNTSKLLDTDTTDSAGRPAFKLAGKRHNKVVPYKMLDTYTVYTPPEVDF